MRVGIIGAGAVGGVIAALLSRAGHEVEVTARGDNLEAIRTGGLRLTGAWGEHTAPVLAGGRLSRSPDLAIVATKATDAERALRDNAEWLSGIPVVVVQNGMRGVTTARAVLRHSDVIGGLAMFAASYLGPGQVSVTTAGATYLGNDDPGLEVQYAAGILGAAMPVTVTHNFAGAQWSKLVVNQINALPAITGLSVQATIADRRLRRVLTKSMQEAVRVSLASGVRFARLQGLSHGLLALFRRLPAPLAQALPLMMKWRMGSTPNPGSTLQSIRRGQKTEIDYLNGAVVEAGRGVSVPTPVNAAITAMVHEVEKTGAFLSPDEVVARLK
jgi:2-dehydropantoate 2-reductase